MFEPHEQKAILFSEEGEENASFHGAVVVLAGGVESPCVFTDVCVELWAFTAYEKAVSFF